MVNTRNPKKGKGKATKLSKKEKSVLQLISLSAQEEFEKVLCDLDILDKDEDYVCKVTQEGGPIQDKSCTSYWGEKGTSELVCTITTADRRDICLELPEDKERQLFDKTHDIFSGAKNAISLTLLINDIKMFELENLGDHGCPLVGTFLGVEIKEGRYNSSW